MPRTEIPGPETTTNTATEPLKECYDLSTAGQLEEALNTLGNTHVWLANQLPLGVIAPADPGASRSERVQYRFTQERRANLPATAIRRHWQNKREEKARQQLLKTFTKFKGSFRDARQNVYFEAIRLQHAEWLSEAGLTLTDFSFLAQGGSQSGEWEPLGPGYVRKSEKKRKIKLPAIKVKTPDWKDPRVVKYITTLKFALTARHQRGLAQPGLPLAYTQKEIKRFYGLQVEEAFTALKNEPLGNNTPLALMVASPATAFELLRMSRPHFIADYLEPTGLARKILEEEEIGKIIAGGSAIDNLDRLEQAISNQELPPTAIPSIQELIDGPENRQLQLGLERMVLSFAVYPPYNRSALILHEVAVPQSEKHWQALVAQWTSNIESAVRTKPVEEDGKKSVDEKAATTIKQHLVLLTAGLGARRSPPDQSSEGLPLQIGSAAIGSSLEAGLADSLTQVLIDCYQGKLVRELVQEEGIIRLAGSHGRSMPTDQLERLTAMFQPSKDYRDVDDVAAACLEYSFPLLTPEAQKNILSRIAKKKDGKERAGTETWTPNEKVIRTILFIGENAKDPDVRNDAIRIAAGMVTSQIDYATLLSCEGTINYDEWRDYVETNHLPEGPRTMHITEGYLGGRALPDTTRRYQQHQTAIFHLLRLVTGPESVNRVEIFSAIVESLGPRTARINALKNPNAEKDFKGILSLIQQVGAQFLELPIGAHQRPQDLTPGWQILKSLNGYLTWLRTPVPQRKIEDLPLPEHLKAAMIELYSGESLKELPEGGTYLMPSGELVKDDDIIEGEVTVI